MCEIAYEVKNADGVTEKELNLKKTHKFPIGSLVEVAVYYLDEYGCRLFVVEHSRDCDGSPLYDLSFNRNAQREYRSAKAESETYYADILNTYDVHRINGSITRHFGEECLVLIR